MSKLTEQQISERKKYILSRRGGLRPVTFEQIATELGMKRRALHEFIAKYMSDLI